MSSEPMVRRSEEAEEGGIVACLAASTGKAMLRNPILPILLVALPLFSIFVPFYATLPNLTNLMLAASVLLLLSIGGALTMISGNIDLSVEGTLAFTTMIAGWLMVARPAGGVGLELNPLLAIVLSVGLGVFIGLLNALMVEALHVNPFIVTIGMLLALKGAAAIPTHATTIYSLPPQYSWVGLHLIFGLSWVAVIAFAICFAISFWLRNSVAGRHVYAIGGAKEAAVENGVSPLKTIMLVYGMSGGLAAVAGWLNAARLDSASASAGDGITFTVFAAIIIGGVALSGGAGNIWGVLGGVILLASIDNVLNLIAINPLYVNFVRGAVIIVAVLLIVARQRLALRFKLQEPAA